MSASAHPDPILLRRELRARRRAITGSARAAAAQHVMRRIDAAGLLKPGRRVALYLSTAEELDTGPLLRRARERGCRVYLPRIVSWRHSRMRFEAIDDGAPIRAGELDLVLLPLVGFDARGGRMGMGKGFYDRHFAARRRLRIWRHPLLVGLAYEAQRVGRLPRAAHDVPLDGIVTESSFEWVSRLPP